MTKTWFITGASRGFGRIWAQAALARGDRVAATARDTSTLDALRGDNFLPLALDVTDRAADFVAVQAAHEHFGRLDVVVNNAGILRDRTIVSMSEQEWDSVIRVHLKGTAGMSHWAAAYWRDLAKSGQPVDARIINTTSGSGLYGSPSQGNYAAKHHIESGVDWEVEISKATK